MLAHLNLPFLHANMSTGWSTHSNVLYPQQADTTTKYKCCSQE